MKYDKDLYTYSGIYDSDMDGELEIREEKLVNCRKPHTCMSCQREINAGEEAVCERGFLDNKPVS